ncbi:MAG: NifB/NifX family molybdenum-iron cluster-binding protein [Bacilli bacterium]
MIKIAVASEKEVISQHFGFCSNFNIYDVENKQILKKEVLSNPGHQPGFLPHFLKDRQVNVVICGGIGGGAIQIFNEENIEVITGANGLAEEAVKAYIAGKLKTTGSVCHAHQHADDCGK